MDSTTIFLAVGAVLGIILGWKPVTKMIGPTRFKMGDSSVYGVFVLAGSICHLVLKIMLSFLLGYILFIINIIKFIIARASGKKTGPDITQNSSDNPSEGNS